RGGGPGLGGLMVSRSFGPGLSCGAGVPSGVPGSEVIEVGAAVHCWLLYAHFASTHDLGSGHGLTADGAETGGFALRPSLGLSPPVAGEAGPAPPVRGSAPATSAATRVRHAPSILSASAGFNGAIDARRPRSPGVPSEPCRHMSPVPSFPQPSATEGAGARLVLREQTKPLADSGRKRRIL